MDEQADVAKDITVQYLILARDGRTDESWQTASNRLYHLRGVGYRYVVDPDIEFPTVVRAPWSVYLRLTGVNTGPARIQFRFHYQNLRGEWDDIDRRDIDHVIPFPEIGGETRDLVLQLLHLIVGGTGLHAVSVHFWYHGVEFESDERVRDPSGSEWTEPGDVFRVPDWVLRGVEYFWIER